jgi:hypothetical protein
VQFAHRGSDALYPSVKKANGKINREISHPGGLWNYEDVWVLAETPTKNARARTRRAHHENWPVGWSGSGRVHLLLVAERRAKTIYLAKRIFFDREFVPWNKVARSGPFNIRLKAKNDRAV